MLTTTASGGAARPSFCCCCPFCPSAATAARAFFNAGRNARRMRNSFTRSSLSASDSAPPFFFCCCCSCSCSHPSPGTDSSQSSTKSCRSRRRFASSHPPIPPPPGPGPPPPFWFLSSSCRQCRCVCATTATAGGSVSQSPKKFPISHPGPIPKSLGVYVPAYLVGRVHLGRQRVARGDGRHELALALLRVGQGVVGEGLEGFRVRVGGPDLGACGGGVCFGGAGVRTPGRSSFLESSYGPVTQSDPIQSPPTHTHTHTYSAALATITTPSASL